MFFILFSIYFFAEYQEPVLKWQPIRFQTLYQSGNFNGDSFRNPSIQYLPSDNSVLVVNDMAYGKDHNLPSKIGIVARKGFINYRNNGSSGIDWENPFLISDPVPDTGYTNPATVVDSKTGTILCLWNGNKDFDQSTAEDPMHIYFSKSIDNGYTWTPVKDITAQIYSSLCTSCQHAEHKQWKAVNISSGTGLQLRDGRIIFPCVINAKYQYGNTKNFMLITDDLGETWIVTTDGPVTNVGQAKAIELNNNEVMLSMAQNGSQKFAFSKNRAENWYSASANSNIQNGNSNGEIKRFTSAIDGYNKNRILLTIPNNNNGEKNYLSILISYDEGTSWPYKKLIEFGESAYSSIATTPNGDILVFYEKGGKTPYDLVVANFSLDYMTDGQDTYQKPNRFRWCLSSEQTSETGRLCPSGAYYQPYNVIDNQIDSIPIYSSDFQISFIDAFRDFTIHLSRDGLQKGTISNYNSKRIKITFAESSTLQRDINLNGNIDVEISRENSKYINFNVDDKVHINIINSRASLLGDKESSITKNSEKTVPIQVALAASTLLFVVGLMIVFMVDRVFLNKKNESQDSSSSQKV